MSDARTRALEAAAQRGEPGAAEALARARCRAGSHDEAVWIPLSAAPALVDARRFAPGDRFHIGGMVIGCPRCGRLMEQDETPAPETYDTLTRAIHEAHAFLAEATACSLCGKIVHRDDVCSTEACRRCHKTVSFEDCVGGATGI